MTESIDVETLPPKTKPGVQLDYIKAKTANVAGGAPAGALRASQPDLKVPSISALKAEKWFPVRMLRHYRPIADYQIGIESTDDDGVDHVTWEDMPDLDLDDEEVNPGLELQVKEGWLVNLRLSEAKAVIGKDIAKREDAID